MPRKQDTFFQILNKSSESKEVDILIYGSIPSFEEDSWRMKNTCDQFLREFKALEKDYDRINIHINSPGGSLYHAFPIFNAIISSKKDIHTYNDGIAASAGGVLLLAGKTVHSAKNGMLMIHNALNIIWGNAQELRESADVLDKYDGVIAQHFADKSGKPVEEIKATYFAYKDKWLTADEAKAESFIDVIEDYESEDAPPENIVNMAFNEVMAHYQKPEKQEGIIAKITNHIRATLNISSPTPNVTPAAADSPVAVTTIQESPKPQTPDMDFKNSLAVLDKPNPSAEDLATIKAEITAFTGANERFTAEEVANKVSAATQPLTEQISNLTTEKDNLQNQVTTLSAEKTEAVNAKTAAEEVANGLRLDIQAYRASGVKPTNSNAGSETPDAIPGDETPDNLYSEADEEVRQARAQLGYPTTAK
jgi:ATP-dependent Clp endopeptidase proteolytic subunit ClpP